MRPWKVPKIWNGDCFIIGGGPSILKQLNVEEEIIKGICNKTLPKSVLSGYFSAIHNQNVIAVNDAFYIGDWIDVSFFGDNRWFDWHKDNLYNFKGLKTTCDTKLLESPDIMRSYGLKVIKRGNELEGLTDNPAQVNWNSNSGAASINLAYHLGARRIFLLGFDMCLSVDRSMTNWHGVHRTRENKPIRGLPFNRHLNYFPRIKQDANRLGLEIINCNPDSRIEQFEKITYREALSRIGIIERKKPIIGWHYGTQDWAFRNLVNELVKQMSEVSHVFNTQGDVNVLLDIKQIDKLKHLPNIIMHIDGNRWYEEAIHEKIKNKTDKY